MALRRVLVLIQVGVAIAPPKTSTHKITCLEERVCASKANARHSFSFFSLFFSLNEYSLLSRLKCMSCNCKY